MTAPAFQRRHFMSGMGVAAAVAAASPAIASPTVAAAIEQKLAGLQGAGQVSGLHALLVARGKELLLEVGRLGRGTGGQHRRDGGVRSVRQRRNTTTALARDHGVG